MIMTESHIICFLFEQEKKRKNDGTILTLIQNIPPIRSAPLKAIPALKVFPILGLALGGILYFASYNEGPFSHDDDSKEIISI